MTPPAVPPEQPAAWRVWGVRALLVAVAVFAFTRSRARGDVDDAGVLALREVSEAAGLDFAHGGPVFHPMLRPIAPQVPATGAGVSVVDADGDGWMDLYVVTSAPGEANALFHNQRDGRFVDVAGRSDAAAVNEDGAYAAMGSVWADVDGDGDADGFVYGWGRQRFLRNDGDLRFTDATAEVGLDRWMNPACAVWFDPDRDGDMDLFVGGYFREDLDLWDPGTPEVMHEDGEDARDGAPDRLFLNRGDGTFEDATDRSGLHGTRWTYACSAADLDDDGWVDLYLANDWSGEAAWRNVGGTFEPFEGLGLDRRSKAGMNVSFGDVANTGELAVYVTNIAAPGWLVQGNNLRISRLAAGAGFPNEAAAPLDQCGYAWGADWGDLDRDGFLDLVVTNGHTSADPDRDYWYHLARVTAGNTGIVRDVRNWAPFEDMSLSGYEPSCLFLNRGDGGFADVAAAAGLDDLLDGRSVVLVDLENRGVLDVVVANQRGPLRAYRNVSSLDGRRWLGLDLRTPTGGVAYGAEVRVRFGGMEQVQVVTGGGGMSSQTDPRVHVGLGAHGRVDGVRITWPDGSEQALGSLALDRYHRLVQP